MKNKRDLKKQFVKMSKGAFVKEHKTLIKVLKKGTNKEQKKEGEDQKKELESEIKGKKKSTAIQDRKDNYDRKRTTSNGYMVKH